MKTKNKIIIATISMIGMFLFGIAFAATVAKPLTAKLLNVGTPKTEKSIYKLIQADPDPVITIETTTITNKYFSKAQLEEKKKNLQSQIDLINKQLKLFPK